MKKMLSVILCVLMLSGMCACGGSNSNQASQTPVSPGNSTSEIEEITFSLGDVSGTGTFLEQNAQFFSQKVSELSDGKMKVEIFSDGLLGTEDALMTNIQTGALEMANFSSTFTNLVKSAGIFDFPYLVTDRDQLALLEEAGIIDVIRTEAESLNIKIVGMNENGFRQITTNTPVVEPSDLKGVVIRTPSNSLRVKTFEAFGATPISISFSELYQSLSQHICDAQENPLATIVSSQFYDYQSCLCIKRLIKAIAKGWAALLIPIVIFGGIFGGVFTPTEAAAVSVVVALLGGIREIKPEMLPKMLIRTALSTAIITFMVAGSASLVTIMTLSKAPQTITAFITGITSNKYIILFCLDILLFGLGMILHGNAIIMLVIPLALPIMKALGVNPIHFGILMCLGVGIGQQTPPVASVLLTTCSIAKVTIPAVWKYLKWFLLASVVSWMFITYIPWISNCIVS